VQAVGSAMLARRAWLVGGGIAVMVPGAVLTLVGYLQDSRCSSPRT
jgi:hypothetical protein